MVSFWCHISPVKWLQEVQETLRLCSFHLRRCYTQAQTGPPGRCRRGSRYVPEVIQVCAGGPPGMCRRWSRYVPEVIQVCAGGPPGMCRRWSITYFWLRVDCRHHCLELIVCCVFDFKRIGPQFCSRLCIRNQNWTFTPTISISFMMHCNSSLFQPLNQSSYFISCIWCEGRASRHQKFAPIPWGGKLTDGDLPLVIELNLV